jgi:hypothetical protein
MENNLDFKPLTLDCIETLRPYFLKNQCRICDCTIGGTFMWRDFFKTEYAIADNILYLKVVYLTGDIAFPTPRGEICGVKKAYERIRDYCRKEGIQARMCAVSEDVLHYMRELYPDLKATSDRAWSDYLYLSDDIKNLPGRKFSGQRNHINRFVREYPDWSFERISESNLSETRDFFVTYSNEHMKDYPAYDEGNIKTIEIIDHFDSYKLFGGILRVGGKIVGASFGETVGDTLFVHIEKASTEYQGAYPMLVNQFAKMYALGDAVHVNREEDDGVEGLRISKTSYHPIALLDKYIVEIP